MPYRITPEVTHGFPVYVDEAGDRRILDNGCMVSATLAASLRGLAMRDAAPELLAALVQVAALVDLAGMPDVVDVIRKARGCV